MLSTFPEKLTTKNMEQQKRIQYLTSVPLTPDIIITISGDGGLSSSDKSKQTSRQLRKARIYNTKTLAHISNEKN